MAAYCTKSDLVERYGLVELAQLTDETAAAGTDDTEINNACDEATSLIDGYLIKQYTLPLASPPPIVRKWACDIARAFLFKDSATPLSVAALNYTEAVKRLQDVARGIASLPGADGMEPAGGSEGIAVVAPAQIFTERLLNAAPGGPWGAGYGCWRTMLPWS